MRQGDVVVHEKGLIPIPGEKLAGLPQLPITDELIDDDDRLGGLVAVGLPIMAVLEVGVGHTVEPDQLRLWVDMPLADQCGAVAGVPENFGQRRVDEHFALWIRRVPVLYIGQYAVARPHLLAGQQR